MSDLDFLSETLEAGLGEKVEEAVTDIPDESSFRDYISNLRRSDSVDYIYINEGQRYIKFQRSAKVLIHLMGLRYLHDFQT